MLPHLVAYDPRGRVVRVPQPVPLRLKMLSRRYHLNTALRRVPSPPGAEAPGAFPTRSLVAEVLQSRGELGFDGSGLDIRHAPTWVLKALQEDQAILSQLPLPIVAHVLFHYLHSYFKRTELHREGAGGAAAGGMASDTAGGHSHRSYGPPATHHHHHNAKHHRKSERDALVAGLTRAKTLGIISRSLMLLRTRLLPQEQGEGEGAPTLVQEQQSSLAVSLMLSALVNARDPPRKRAIARALDLWLEDDRAEKDDGGHRAEKDSKGNTGSGAHARVQAGGGTTTGAPGKSSLERLRMVLSPPSATTTTRTPAPPALTPWVLSLAERLPALFAPLPPLSSSPSSDAEKERNNRNSRNSTSGSTWLKSEWERLQGIIATALVALLDTEAVTGYGAPRDAWRWLEGLWRMKLASVNAPKPSLTQPGERKGVRSRINAPLLSELSVSDAMLGDHAARFLLKYPLAIRALLRRHHPTMSEALASMLVNAITASASSSSSSSSLSQHPPSSARSSAPPSNTSSPNNNSNSTNTNDEKRDTDRKEDGDGGDDDNLDPFSTKLLVERDWIEKESPLRSAPLSLALWRASAALLSLLGEEARRGPQATSLANLVIGDGGEEGAKLARVTRTAAGGRRGGAWAFNAMELRRMLWSGAKDLADCALRVVKDISPVIALLRASAAAPPGIPAHVLARLDAAVATNASGPLAANPSLDLYASSSLSQDALEILSESVRLQEASRGGSAGGGGGGGAPPPGAAAVEALAAGAAKMEEVEAEEAEENKERDKQNDRKYDDDAGEDDGEVKLLRLAGCAAGGRGVGAARRLAVEAAGSAAQALTLVFALDKAPKDVMDGLERRWVVCQPVFLASMAGAIHGGEAGGAGRAEEAKAACLRVLARLSSDKARSELERRLALTPPADKGTSHAALSRRRKRSQGRLSTTSTPSKRQNTNAVAANKENNQENGRGSNVTRDTGLGGSNKMTRPAEEKARSTRMKAAAAARGGGGQGGASALERSFVESCGVLFEETLKKHWDRERLVLFHLAARDPEVVIRRGGLLCRVLDNHLNLTMQQFLKLRTSSMFSDAILIITCLLPALTPVKPAKSPESNHAIATAGGRSSSSSDSIHVVGTLIEKVAALVMKNGKNRELASSIASLVFQTSNLLLLSWKKHPKETTALLQTYLPVISHVGSIYDWMRRGEEKSADAYSEAGERGAGAVAMMRALADPVGGGVGWVKRRESIANREISKRCRDVTLGARSLEFSSSHQGILALRYALDAVSEALRDAVRVSPGAAAQVAGALVLMRQVLESNSFDVLAESTLRCLRAFIMTASHNAPQAAARAAEMVFDVCKLKASGLVFDGSEMEDPQSQRRRGWMEEVCSVMQFSGQCASRLVRYVHKEGVPRWALRSMFVEPPPPPETTC